MLNCFKDYKICIHFAYHIFDFVQQKKAKFTMEQPYMVHILYNVNTLIVVVLVTSGAISASEELISLNVDNKDLDVNIHTTRQ